MKIDILGMKMILHEAVQKVIFDSAVMLVKPDLTVQG